MAAVSFSIHNWLLCRISMSHLMPLEHWVMELCFRITGSQAHGFQNRSPNRSSTKNYSLLWLQRWDPQWVSKRVLFLSDNSSVVEILRSGTSRALTIMSLNRYLCLLAASYSFSFTASPVSGKCNAIANSLSCFQFQRFQHLAPHADHDQTHIPQQLLLDFDLLWQKNAISTWLMVLPLLRKKFLSPALLPSFLHSGQ